MRMRKRVLSVALCFMMVVACLMPAVNVKAGEGDEMMKYKKNKTYVLVKYKKGYGLSHYRYVFDLDFMNKLMGITSMSISSSKKSVVKIAKGVYTDSNNSKNGTFTMQPNKVGTTKIKVKVSKNGKKYTYTFKIKVVNHQNPFKTIKMGKKNLTSKFKKGVYYRFNSTGKKEKLSLKPAKNWKVKRIQCTYYNTQTKKYITKKIKSGASIPAATKESGTSISIRMQNKKTKAIEVFYIDVKTK